MSKRIELDIFDEEIIAANRDGYMTKAQRKRVDAIRQDVRFVQYMAMGITALLLISFAQDKEVLLYCGTCIGLYTVSILIFGFYDTRRANRDLYKGLVESIEGIVILRSSPLRLKIRDKHFRVSRGVYQKVQNQSQKYFRVYYAPHSNTLLSMEMPGILFDTSQIVDPSRLEDDTHVPTETQEIHDNYIED